MGLNDSYSRIRSQILLQVPLPGLSKVFSLIVQEEKQRRLGVRSIASMDTLTLNSTSSSLDCAITCKNKRPVCSHCNIDGHIVDKCYKLHGYPLGYKSKQNVVGNKTY